MSVGNGPISVEYLTLFQLKGLTQNRHFIKLVVWHKEKTATETNAWLNQNSDRDKDIHINTGSALDSDSAKQTFYIYSTDLHQDLDLGN